MVIQKTMQSLFGGRIFSSWFTFVQAREVNLIVTQGINSPKTNSWNLQRQDSFRKKTCSDSMSIFRGVPRPKTTESFTPEKLQVILSYKSLVEIQHRPTRPCDDLEMFGCFFGVMGLVSRSIRVNHCQTQGMSWWYTHQNWWFPSCGLDAYAKRIA